MFLVTRAGTGAADVDLNRTPVCEAPAGCKCLACGYGWYGPPCAKAAKSMLEHLKSQGAAIGAGAMGEQWVHKVKRLTNLQSYKGPRFDDLVFANVARVTVPAVPAAVGKAKGKGKAKAQAQAQARAAPKTRSAPKAKAKARAGAAPKAQARATAQAKGKSRGQAKAPAKSQTKPKARPSLKRPAAGH